MRNKLRTAHAAAWLLGGAVLAVSGRAAAAACPSGPTTVYLNGSTAAPPLIAAVANVLGSSVNIIYQRPGSCQGPDHLLNKTPGLESAAWLQPGTGAAGTACTLPTLPAPTNAAGAVVDIGVSDVYASTCQATFDPNLPAVGTGTKDFLGPIQAMTLAVPTASTATTISAEAAYMVFGYAADTAAHTIAPWSVPGDIFTRYYDSGTLEMTATAIGLVGSKWKNATCNPNTSTCPQTTTGAGGEATALTTAAMKGTADTNAAIGNLGDQNLVTGVRQLAFQAKGQECAYYPDSTSTALDKINVRQGRYAIWGPLHMIVDVDQNGQPVGQNNNTAAVQTVINAFTATSQEPAALSGDAGVDGGVTSLTEDQVGALVDAISAPTVRIIPQCAMQVQRTSEIGPEASYAPPAACSCRFENATGVAVAGHTCTACTAANASTTCTGATPKCRFGYCEAE